jgi:poly-beta-1,6-N-acetyl-D-glucosamine synthase
MNAGYVIITPAYNEANYIAGTMESVIRQTLLPKRWVIVDDGSLDDTPAVVSSYAQEHAFIHCFQRRRDNAQSYFASNVYAIMEGVRQVADIDYGFLAILDADIVLPDDYYEQILDRFRADPLLGVASGVYENLVDGRLQRVLSDRRSTPKAIQVFRRQCFEQIGGYVPLRHGGEDTCACILARMNGWKSWSFPEVKVIHRRPTGVGNAKSLLRARFVQGLSECTLATHPLFMVVKSLRRCFVERPILLAGILRFCGYVYGCLKREPCQIPPQVAKYARQEQIGRLFHFNRVPSAHGLGVKA